MVSIEYLSPLRNNYSCLLNLPYMWLKTRNMGSPLRIETTNDGLLIKVVNHYTL